MVANGRGFGWCVSACGMVFGGVIEYVGLDVLNGVIGDSRRYKGLDLISTMHEWQRKHCGRTTLIRESHSDTMFKLIIYY